MNFQCTCNFGLKYPVDFLPAIHPLEWELSLHVSTELKWDCAWKCIIMRFFLKMWKPSTQQFTVYPLTVHIWVMGWLIFMYQMWYSVSIKYTCNFTCKQSNVPISSFISVWVRWNRRIWHAWKLRYFLCPSCLLCPAVWFSDCFFLLLC